jgi:hypothetical protein
MENIEDILIQNSKKVFKYDLDMNFICEYPSVNNADKILGLHSSNISKCCNHKVKTVGGYIWRFEGDFTPIKEDMRKYNGKLKIEFSN